jgi:parvulin-like peptidyl-prolyl isomerase
MEQDQTIARIGNLNISQSEYVTILARHFSKKDNYQEITLKQKKEILENLIIKKLKLNAAYDHKLHQEKEFVDAVNRYRNSLVQKRYYEKMVIDRIVHANEIDTFLENQRFKVTASHILIAFKEVNPRTQRSKDDALTLVEELIERLAKGDVFSDLANTYSDDPTVKHNLGSLGSFSWGQMVEPFQEAVMSMEVGEIRGPVETRYGYHIIRLEDRKERTDYILPSDEEALFEIKQKIFASRADSGKVLWNRHITQLKDESDFRIHTTALNNLAIGISERIYEGEISYEAFIPEIRQTALASWQEETFTLDELFAPHKERLARYVVKLKQIHILKREVEEQAVNKLILNDARRQGLYEDDFVTRYTALMEEEHLLQQIETRQVSDQINLTEGEAYQYYTENPKKFEKPAELELWEIFVTDEKKSQDILKKARSGSDFEQLAKNYSEDKQYASKGGYLGYRGKGTRGAVTQNAFKSGSGKIGGPIQYRNGWTVFKTGRIKDTSIRPFDEVKNRAKSFLRRERMTSKRREWEQNLRNLYTIDVDENLLARV